VSRLSRQCGIINISQPYRPPRPVTGIALLFFNKIDTDKKSKHINTFENFFLILNLFSFIVDTLDGVSNYSHKRCRRNCVRKLHGSRSRSRAPMLQRVETRQCSGSRGCDAVALFLDATLEKYMNRSEERQQVNSNGFFFAPVPVNFPLVTSRLACLLSRHCSCTESPKLSFAVSKCV
jgi:hypothetical protein